MKSAHLKIWFTLWLTLLFSAQIYASDPIYTGFFSNKALDGYDTVAYFTENKPVKGRSEWMTTYQGADWYFSTQKHLEMFTAAPEKYAPQYGGYCAWAIAEKNDYASADPLQWSLVDGKLYLNYDADIKAKWEQNRAAFIRQGNINWPILTGQ
ncbi:YHS domain-containing (seleno)protein [Vibrio quintilis]|uniref:YHS domain protein n=1 Tax=Vibrio quintilis TaxID=1117707 RepID=A0A1M7YWF2_9VIBR|nr:YHS domain-containing (seleno)protein [Vibrio quintilis]SHO56895.1 YHS domain protein [Vibrio quintilis]